MKRLNKVTIVGVGLIGGSIGLDIRAKRLAKEVVGLGRRKSSVKKALEMGTITKGTLNIGEGVRDADLVIMATPVLSIPKLVKKMAPYLKRGCLITDVGSVKEGLIRDIERVLPKGVEFIGGHPMAGSEQRGVAKARRGLFKDSICFITRSRRTPLSSLREIVSFWKALGAMVVTLSPAAHDMIVSEISHLPHMIIFALLSGVEPGSLKFASTGFKDTTRIAASEANIWKDIGIANKREILKSIAKFNRSLGKIERALKREDSAALIKIFTRARMKRAKI